MEALNQRKEAGHPSMKMSVTHRMNSETFASIMKLGAGLKKKGKKKGKKKVGWCPNSQDLSGSRFHVSWGYILKQDATTQNKNDFLQIYISDKLKHLLFLVDKETDI